MLFKIFNKDTLDAIIAISKNAKQGANAKNYYGKWQYKRSLILKIKSFSKYMDHKMENNA